MTVITEPAAHVAARYALAAERPEAWIALRPEAEVAAELADVLRRADAGEPLPLATLAEPCGVRAMAGQLLDTARMPWTEVFVGGGVAAVSAAVMAGLGVAALAPRMLALGAVDVGPRLGLPTLPRLPVLLHTRVREGRPRAALDALGAAFKSAVRG